MKRGTFTFTSTSAAFTLWNTSINSIPTPTIRRPAPKQTSLELASGDRVEHTAFGPGIVLSVKPAGGDALLEIEFEKSGVRRLMKNFASEYLKKL